MTRSALHQIDRTRQSNERSTLPFSGRYLAAQSEVTGCQQREADDDAELRAVAMPADASALPIEPRLRFQAERPEPMLAPKACH